MKNIFRKAKETICCVITRIIPLNALVAVNKAEAKRDFKKATKVLRKIDIKVITEFVLPKRSSSRLSYLYFIVMVVLLKTPICLAVVKYSVPQSMRKAS